jgi:hypothetical protein
LVTGPRGFRSIKVHPRADWCGVGFEDAANDDARLPSPEFHIAALKETDCVAGHVRFELRNVGTNYAFEKSRKFLGSRRILATETIRA